MNCRAAKAERAGTFTAAMFTNKKPFYWVHLKFYYEKNRESKTRAEKIPKGRRNFMRDRRFSGDADHSSPLGCGGVSLVEWFLVFRRIIAINLLKWRTF